MPDSPATSTTTTERDTRRPFVLVTGLSGAGRGTALAALEDMGYVAVDNVPLPLLGDLMRSTAGSPGEMAAPLAFGVDTRTYGFDPHDLVRRIRELRLRADITARLLFLDCDSETLLRRYTESRRPHPLAPDRPVKDGIGEERKQLGWVRDSADVVIDTSALSPHALQAAPGRPLRARPQPRHAARGDVVLLPPRPAARGRPGVRRALPEEPALRAGAEAADRPRSGGRGLRRQRSRLPAVHRFA